MWGPRNDTSNASRSVVFGVITAVEIGTREINYRRIPSIRSVSMLQPRGGLDDRRAGTHFFEPGGYKIEPLLTKMVNNDI